MSTTCLLIFPTAQVSNHVYYMSIVATLLTIILLLLSVIAALIFVVKLAKETFFAVGGEMREATIAAQHDANMNDISANTVKLPTLP